MQVEVGGHIRFAESLLARVQLPEQTAEELTALISAISFRQRDPHLYMAVVGEFNSGKSTFINALLRDKLLTTAAVVTTAASTLIQHGPELDFEVLFTNHRQLRYQTDASNIWEQIQTLAPAPLDVQRDVRQALALITAEESISSHVRSVVINHPSPFLGSGVVIIDTPGINGEHQRHAEIIQQVISRQADVAIIIIPASFAASNVLMDFLEHALQPLLHRSVFVVSQMDKVPESEHKRVLLHIQLRLKALLKTDRPITLHTAAPQLLLDHLIKGTALPIEQRAWPPRFHGLASALSEWLRWQRKYSIAETTLRLLTRLFNELDEHLREQLRRYEAKETEARNMQDPSASLTMLKRLAGELPSLTRLQEQAQADLKEIAQRQQMLQAHLGELTRVRSW
jgi:GTP-binding protein EngB required for normal cell division